MNSINTLASEELLRFLDQDGGDEAEAEPLGLETIASSLPVSDISLQRVAGPAVPPLLCTGERWGLSAEEQELLLLVLKDQDMDESQGRESCGSEVGTTSCTRVSKTSTAHLVVSDGHDHQELTTKTTTSLTTTTLKNHKKKKKKPRPNRRRRKHEVDELRIEVMELEEKLLQLRTQSRALIETALLGNGTLLASRQNDSLVLPRRVLDASAPPASVWERIGRFEREEARTAIAENLRLRAMYESQLLTLQRLETAYRSQFDLEAVGLPPVVAYGQPLGKRPRSDPFDDDFAIFASLGQDFDARFEGIDAILDTARLLHFDGEMVAQLRPKIDAEGRCFMEQMHSRVVPEDMFIMDIAINETQKDPRMHRAHKAYEIWHATDTVSFVKTEDVIRLPHAEALITTRMAVKRFVRADRVAGVWDGVVDISGCVSMRLSEKGWNMLRPPRSMLANRDGGPLSVEQSCIRYYPIDRTVRSERDLNTGTVNRILVESYQRHLACMHEVTEEILRGQFSELAL